MAARRISATSPTVTIPITQENWDRAKKADSGGCLIADALKDKGFTGVTVDMATIRFSDRKKGRRYTYLTPPDGQMLLLGFDQGWNIPVEEVVVRRAVKIEQIVSSRQRQDDRRARIAELEAKDKDGSITSDEKRSLARYRKNPDGRPTKREPQRVAGTTGSREPVILGGTAIKQGEAHPTLLRRQRMYGAKQAHPGVVFDEAVSAKTQDLELENERLRAQVAELS